jgi:hypothetical protein
MEGAFLLGGIEDLADLARRRMRAGDHRAVDEEELALQTVREGAADGGFAGSRRAGEQHPALGLEAVLGGERVVFQRQRDLGFERADYVVDALEIAQIHRRDFLEVDIARQVVFAQIGDEFVRGKSGAAAERLAGAFQLVRRQCGAETMHLGVIDAGSDFRRQPRLANRGVVSRA